MLLDFEGFDHFTLAGTPGMYAAVGTNNNSALGDGVFGYGRHAVSNNLANSWAGRNLATNEQILLANFHFRTPAAPGTSSTWFLFTDGGSAQMGLRFDASQRYTFVRGTTVVATSAVPVVVGAWLFLQFRVLINDVAGQADLWVNGVNVLSFAGNTRQTANNYVNGWRWGYAQGTPASHFDNVVIYNEAGAAPNARTPETRVYFSLPSAPGPVTQFTPNGAATNWECVDENPPDDNTTYVSAAAAGLTDVYDIPANAIPAGADVYGVMARALARKDDAGANELDVLLRSGGTNYPSGSPVALSSSFVYQWQTWTENPATPGTPWTPGGANAALPGVTRTT